MSSRLNILDSLALAISQRSLKKLFHAILLPQEWQLGQPAPPWPAQLRSLSLADLCGSARRNPRFPNLYPNLPRLLHRNLRSGPWVVKMQSSLVLFFSLTLRHLRTHRKSNSFQKDRKRKNGSDELSCSIFAKKIHWLLLKRTNKPTKNHRVVQGGGKNKLLRTFFDSFRLGRESRQSEEDH
uniref:Uncharacterized protein n=1 Tax=Brassica campestris TaxID=3711 RepID=M4D7J4_BRACM